MAHSILVLQARCLAQATSALSGWTATARFDEFGGPIGTGSEAILRLPAESGLAPIIAMIHFEHGQYRLRNKGPVDIHCNGLRMVPGKNHVLEHGDVIAWPGFEVAVLLLDDRAPARPATVAPPQPLARGRGWTRSKPPAPAQALPEMAPEAAPQAAIDSAAEPACAPAAEQAADPVAEPVLLGVSTPTASAPGETFIVQVAAYIASQEQQVQTLMRQAGGDPQNLQMGQTPDGQARWQRDAPVRVEVSGVGLQFEGDASDDFLWNGSQHISEFLVTADPAFKGKKAFLKVTVLLAAMPVAKMIAQIPLNARGVPVSDSGAQPAVAAPSAVQTVHATPVRKVFASHSSKDKPRVLDMLNALTSIDRGLQVFTDCLDLVTQESFKPQLQREIESADGFYLFWSVNSAASPWVKWEIDTARQRPGLDAMMLIPLDPPMLAPPPSGLEDRHLDSRYALARDGVLARLEQARASAKP